ncbi:NADPH:quinone oxidoreductase family protein [Sphingomonas mesophila]|uniref:NADPH:quinone oxidoreductase family protein n=1 Tax=Sphingomonas mesophila TaxID=2303576 RepID=UPI000E56C36A|nr:NADPH:quinone oxidoreductase family protein [Sphingomonas mesophila]
MKALLSRAAGGPETLELGEIDAPDVSPGHLLVRVRACAINFPDVLIIEDKYQFKPPRPFAPGGEIAGEVIAVGAGVEGWSVGDRVIGATGWNGLAEQALLPAANAFLLPDNRDFAEGSALLMTYATAIHALVDRGAIKPKELMIVLGAGGGVGLAAVEIGKALGAWVLACASSEEKCTAARAAGADASLKYPAGPLDPAAQKQIAKDLKDIAGPNGAQLVFDPVGGDYAEPALRALGWEGRYLVVGFPAGIPSIPLNLTLLKSCDIRGVFWGAFAGREPERNRGHVAELFRLWDDGKIAPKVSATYPLERAGEAIAALGARSAIGKLVVTIP